MNRGCTKKRKGEGGGTPTAVRPQKKPAEEFRAKKGKEWDGDESAKELFLLWQKHRKKCLLQCEEEKISCSGRTETHQRADEEAVDDPAIIEEVEAEVVEDLSGKESSDIAPEKEKNIKQKKRLMKQEKRLRQEEKKRQMKQEKRLRQEKKRVMKQKKRLRQKEKKRLMKQEKKRLRQEEKKRLIQKEKKRLI
ncbi:trichohyalin-like [Macrosteles quadrilineatus]|uniref:trichohyalin-like n=1 Tax=Macrosteles quadrilineatus TaxID=74068 RepID=UPI0023E25BEA|nr:trichohyalin-like [Macrosteles quadrilineatus]